MAMYKNPLNKIRCISDAVAQSVISGASSTGGALLGGFFGLGMTKRNNEAAAEREEAARRQNYYFNEMAANAADARTRALYNDLYSPKAQWEQMQELGMSPSIMAGGLNGISGQSGAQGAGAAGVAPNVFGLDPLSGAQIAKTLAETSLIKAETDKTKSETTKQDLLNDFQEMANTLQLEEFQILQSGVTEADGTQTSFNEIAMNYDNFEDFLKNVRENSSYGSKESQVQALRKIYKNSHVIGRDIAVLSGEKVSAEFDKDLLNTLSAQNFVNLSAEEAVSELRKNISVNELTEYQKDAWNNLLERIGKKSETGRDILIVGGMILNQALSNYSNINLRRTKADITHKSGK